MRFFHVLVALLFLLFAWWQLNDPDSGRWVALYLYVAAVAAATAFDLRIGRWVLAGLLVAGLWWLTLLPDFIRWLGQGAPSIVGSMQAQTPWIELTREFLGLSLCLLVLGGYAWTGRRKKSARQEG